VNQGLAQDSWVIPMVETLLTTVEMKQMELCLQSLSDRGLSRFFVHLLGCRRRYKGRGGAPLTLFELTYSTQ
jgi:hypothetical protein